jgi:hypothetical protein
MDERDAERLLAKYRPVGPPPELKAFALCAGPRLRIWPWAAAAAVLMAATVALHVATTRSIDRMAPPLTDPVNALADLLGGDEEARRAAQVIVTEQSIRDADAARSVNDALQELMNGSR